MDLIGTVPNYDVYLTVAEMRASTAGLVHDYPDLVTVRPVGESRRGEKIELISIGEGERNALVYAGAHANEALGAMTAEFLSRHLCENDRLRREMGYAWHVIKCIDPDSMRLNEGWFKGPFTELHYHANPGCVSWCTRTPMPVGLRRGPSTSAPSTGRSTRASAFGACSYAFWTPKSLLEVKPTA